MTYKIGKFSVSCSALQMYIVDPSSHTYGAPPMCWALLLILPAARELSVIIPTLPRN